MLQHSPYTLLSVDMAQSVLRNADVSRSYTPFGYLPGRQAETAFTGRRLESDLYLLGNGHRAYLPALKRFISADAASPFGRGGLNAYAYCGAEPVNRSDSQGASWTKLLGKLWLKAKSARSVRSALELRYANGGQGKVLRFATDEVVDPTLMYNALGTHLSATSSSFDVMVGNARLVKEGAKSFHPIPGYAALRDPSLFEKAIKRQHSTLWANEPIKPVSPGDWPSLHRGPLDLENSDVRRTVLSYLYYQELADPRVVQARGRVDPWAAAAREHS